MITCSNKRLEDVIAQERRDETYARLIKSKGYVRIGDHRINVNRTLETRFWSKVEKTDDCWKWIDYKDRHGYGVFYSRHIPFAAHRVAYTLIHGHIPDNLTLDHLCRNRACVNPKHLQAVSFYENFIRGESQFAINKRKTHCKYGHAFAKESILKNGERRCLECAKIRIRAWWQKQKAERNKL